jgi:hypothetical protein
MNMNLVTMSPGFDNFTAIKQIHFIVKICFGRNMMKLKGNYYKYKCVSEKNFPCA